MKWIGRIIYIVAIFFIGILVFRLSQIGSQLNYYNANGPSLLESNERQKYMEVYMTANLVKEYLNDPIYLAENKDEKFPFEFAIYNVKVKFKEGEKYFLAFYFNDLGMDLENIISDYKKFELDKNSAAIQIEIKMAGSEEKSVEIFSLDFDARMPAILIELTKDDNKNDFFRYQYIEDNKIESNLSEIIEEIKFTLIDVTKGKEEEDKVETPIATLTHNEEAIMNPNVSDILELDEKIFVSTNFNGKIENYEKTEDYNDKTKLGLTHVSDLKKFQKNIYINLAIYGAVIIVITYLVYFLKPTISYFNNKKALKEKEVKVIENNSSKNIFKE